MAFRVLGLACASVALAAAQSTAPVLLAHADSLELRSGWVRTVFNLTRGSFDIVQGCFKGDGNFTSSPNLAGEVGAVPDGTRRGAVSIVISGAPGGTASTSSSNRAVPLAYTVVSNTSQVAAFSVQLTDSASLLSVTLVVQLDATNPRRLTLNASATATSSFSATMVALSTTWTSPCSIAWYDRGVRQGMNMPSGYISTTDPLRRFYAIGDGATGAAEILTLSESTARAPGSYIYAGMQGQYRTLGGMGLVMWGAASPVDQWVDGYAGTAVPVQSGAASPLLSLGIYPNDLAFPPSEVPPTLPSAVDVPELASVLIAAHGAAVSALHSYDFSPEVRAAPCLVYHGGQCYSPLYNFYDPDSAISNSAMLYTFDKAVQGQVRGQLETNMQYVCDGSDASRCTKGQCIHHFVGNCAGGGPECLCVQNPNGRQDCVIYDAISGAVQTGPNVFTLLAALRYAGTTGDAAWLAAQAPTLRNMMSFLDSAFDENIGLYLAPGSLQIDVFIRQNYTADSNAMAVILCELFADAEDSLGNTTAGDFYRSRAAAVRSGMNKYLLAPSGDHYCTQSDPMPGGGIKTCSRDFIDYDANALAVAARVPANSSVANKILARMDVGTCTHTGRATWVSEIFYDAENCVGGNTGDSAVSMGRIGWQDALARQAVGDAAAIAVFESKIFDPLHADLLRRTWLPERYDCKGADAHNMYYFEYPSTVAMMLYEVKYGISLQMTKVVVNPLGSSPNFDFALGELHIGYYGTAAGGNGFYAKLTNLHSGPRNFTVTRMSPGGYTVVQTGLPPHPVSVGGDGVLSFVAQVGKSFAVTVKKSS